MKWNSVCDNPKGPYERGNRDILLTDGKEIFLGHIKENILHIFYGDGNTKIQFSHWGELNAVDLPNNEDSHRFVFNTNGEGWRHE